jgi:ankyrin repeat protein
MQKSKMQNRLKLLMQEPAVIIKEKLDEESFLSAIAAGDSARVRTALAQEGCLIYARDDRGRSAFHMLHPTDLTMLDALCDSVRDSVILTKAFFCTCHDNDKEQNPALYSWAAAEYEKSSQSHPILLALRRFMFHTRDLWCTRTLKTFKDVTCQDVIAYLRLVGKAKGNTILHVASDFSLVSELLGMGFDLVPNDRKRLPIHEWVLNLRASPDKTKLLNMGSWNDWWWKDDRGSTAFHYLMGLEPPFALEGSDMDALLREPALFEEEIQYGAIWMRKNDDGDTPLHVMCRTSNRIQDPEYYKRILCADFPNGPTVRPECLLIYSDADGRLPHHIAYVYRGPDGAQDFMDLLDFSAHWLYIDELRIFSRMLHMPDLSHGQTLLHMASDNGDELLVRKLLPIFEAFGSGIDARTSHPVPMIKYEETVNDGTVYPEVETEYEPLDGNEFSSNEKCGKTALHFANTASIARLLLENGADPAARSFSRTMPLHYAKNAEIAVLLLDAGAPIDGVSVSFLGMDDRTPLETSIDDMRWDVAEVLIRRGAAVDGFVVQRNITAMNLGYIVVGNEIRNQNQTEYFRNDTPLQRVWDNLMSHTRCVEQPHHIVGRRVVAELLMRRGASILASSNKNLPFGKTPPDILEKRHVLQEFIATMLAHDAALQIPDDEFDAYWDSRIPSPCYGLLEQIDALKKRYGNKVLAHVGKRVPEAQKACVHEIMRGCYFRKISEPACWTILKFYVM